MKTKLLVVSLLTAFIGLTTTSCDYEALDPAIDTTIVENPTTPGENPGGTPGETPGGENPGGENPGGGTSGDYLPLAINNRWSYSRSNGEEYNILLTEVNTFGGLPYYKYSASAGSEAGVGAADFWFAKSAGSYFLRTGTVTFTVGTFSGTQTGSEMIILKDNLAVGETWEGSYEVTTTYTDPSIPSIEMQNEFTGTILEKGVSAAVNNVTYPDVIKVRIERTATMFLNNTNAGVTEVTTVYWFAKNVGIIKTIHDETSSAGTTSYTDNLVGYALN